MARTLTNTRDRAERLVVEAISRQSRRHPSWHRRRDERHDMAGSLHARWVETHAPRGPRGTADTSEGARLHDLTDQQLGLVALCLFGGHSYVRAGSTLSLSPAEASGQLRDALLTLVDHSPPPELSGDNLVSVQGAPAVLPWRRSDSGALPDP